MKKLEGKVAVVTGASKGIGAGIAKQLAAEGASVVVNYSSSKKGADIVVAEITEKGGKAIAVGANVAKKSDIEKLFAETTKAYGKVDILVNNAGIYEFQPLESITEEHFNKHFGLNVLGLLLTTQEAVKHFGDRGGSIINLSSVVGRNGAPGATVYSATKGAVNTITQSLSKELGPKKIRVNGVAPGLVVTEGTAVLGVSDSENEFNKAFVAQTPVGRVGQPQDIATVVAFLASDDSSWVSGETWYVAGGFQ
jgi:3-oxoacyl-[acyl-carrier protein] reductase